MAAADTLRTVDGGTLLVVGRRREPGRIAPLVWTRPGQVGEPGPVDALPSLPGASGSSEISQRVSVEGMPPEGNAVTWDGGEIPWPWHFGGLFGGLDDWSVSDVSWETGSDPASPAAGGGWLRTDSRASQADSGVHGGARLSTAAASAATWGRLGSWGFQLSFRRIWLDALLALAQHEGWVDKAITARFWDATAALSWTSGPWSAGVGYMQSSDTLALAYSEGGTFGWSWSNRLLPAHVQWQGRDLILRLEGSLATYQLASARDTFENASLQASWRLDPALFLKLGASAKSVQVNLNPGGGRKSMGRAWTGVAEEIGPWKLEGWAGAYADSADPVSPEGGLSVSRACGAWTLGSAAQTRLVGVSIADPAVDGLDNPAPYFWLPRGKASRTSSWNLSVQVAPAPLPGGLQSRTSLLGWTRRLDGSWRWNEESSVDMLRSNTPAARADGWSLGLDASQDLFFRGLELHGRIVVSEDRLHYLDGAEDPRDGWASWDQRLHGNGSIHWWWKGSPRTAPGERYLKSGLSLDASTGILRPCVVGWTLGSSRYSEPIVAMRRARYFRMDADLVEWGRQGRWKLWWKIVNLTNHVNPAGWAAGNPGEPSTPDGQIPFLPVVLGGEISF